MDDLVATGTANHVKNSFPSHVACRWRLHSPLRTCYRCGGPRQSALRKVDH
jgi:hypothetical protein